jgi:hypothetical protein
MVSRAARMGVTVALTVASAVARADDSDATADFNYGLSEMMAHRYSTGCPALERSLQRDARPGTLFTLAECTLKWGRTASALASYKQYLALYERMPSEQKAKQAERARIASAERDALETSVPRLSVRLPEGAPPGVVVQRDEVVLDATVLGVAIAVDPGEHVVRTRLPDGAASEQRVTLADGEGRIVFATLPGPAPAAPSSLLMPTPVPIAPSPAFSAVEPLPPSRGAGTRRPWLLLAGGIGVGGGVVAGIAGGLAVAKQSTIASECSASGACRSQRGVDAGNSAHDLANVETVALAAAGVGLAAALILWLTEPGPPRRTSAGRGAGVGLLGTGVAATW